MSFKLRADLINKIESQAEHLLKDSRGSHDLDHTKRVYRLAEVIGKAEKADLSIIRLAALLHDIGRHHQDKHNGKHCHAIVGARMSATILKEHNLPGPIIKQICHCISTHRFRETNKPETIEAKVLFDADKLDAIGAVGIGRAFLFAGEIGAKLHNKDIDIYKTKEYTIEDTAYREYIHKLRLIKNKMYTKKGKLLAQQRHKFMEKFFQQLTHEAEGKC